MTYKTFTRAATNWEEFSKAQKTTIERGLSLEDARKQCKEFNDNRTPEQIRRGLKMEFTSE